MNDRPCWFPSLKLPLTMHDGILWATRRTEGFLVVFSGAIVVARPMSLVAQGDTGPARSGGQQASRAGILGGKEEKEKKGRNWAKWRLVIGAVRAFVKELQLVNNAT